MANGFVHDVQALVAFGLPYHHVNTWKDAASQRIPGLRHRRVRHRWYWEFGRAWDLTNPFPDRIKQSAQRIGDTRGPVRAEEYMVSVSHDYLDKIWDFDGLPREVRAYKRKHMEAFHLWLILNPEVLSDWAGVDVFMGRIHRIIGRDEVWEEAPELKAEYLRLRERALFLLRCDKKLQRMLKKYG